MKKKILILALGLSLISTVTYACYKTKQCCKQDYTGVSCITKCDYELCPYNYPMEIKN